MWEYAESANPQKNQVHTFRNSSSHLHFCPQPLSHVPTTRFTLRLTPRGVLQLHGPLTTGGPPQAALHTNTYPVNRSSSPTSSRHAKYQTACSMPPSPCYAVPYHSSSSHPSSPGASSLS